VARIGKERNAYRLSVGKPKKVHLEDPGLGGKKILKLILNV
jgi:hypothetical protein